MDDSSPATQTDIRMVLQRVDNLNDSLQSLGQSMQKMYGDLHHSMQKMHKSLYDADDQILTILTNIDNRLTTQDKDHERRLKKLEAQAA